MGSSVLFGVFPSYTSGMNNSFNEHIAKICGLELATLAGSYKYSLFGGTTAVIEGHKGISSYLDNEIGFYLPSGTISVSGSDLKIKCLGKSFAVIVGQIDKVEVTTK